MALIAGAQNVDEVHTALVAAVAGRHHLEKRLNESVKRVLDFKGVKGPCSKGGAQPTTSGDAQTSTSAASGTTVLEHDPVGGGQPCRPGVTRPPSSG